MRRRRRTENRLRRAGLSTPVGGIDRPGGRRELGGSLEPLFDPGSRDDLLAVAEAKPGSEGAVLVPEPVELRVKSVNVFLDLGVVLCGEAVPKLGTLLTQALDLRVDS